MKKLLPSEKSVSVRSLTAISIFFLLSFLPLLVKSQLSVNGTTTYTCVGGSTGTITASGSGGSTPYTYNINGGTYQSSAVFSSLAAGTYTLGIKSSTNATATRSVTVSSFPNSPDAQTVYGSNAWIGYVYDGTAFNNFLGTYNEGVNFNQSFGGGDAFCFSVSSSLGTRTVNTETFSVRYKMNSSWRGLYVADLGSDDGGRLIVDGITVYNNWSDQAFSLKPRVLFNLNGNSNLNYEFYENSGGHQAAFQGLTLVFGNTLSTNTSQTLCVGKPGETISGDVFGTMPTGISVSGTGYKWVYSTTPGGAQTDIAGATTATFTPSTSAAPFNTPGTYYVYRTAFLRSTNNVPSSSTTIQNLSNVATIVVSPFSSAGSQTTAGTDSWIAHIYDGTAFDTYVGYSTESENFSRNFGDASCYSVTSSSGAASIYTEQFSVKYRMNSTRDGLYVSDIGYDDGARLTVDGTMVFNDWSDHSYTFRPRVLMNLTGSSSLLFEYYENGAQNTATFQSTTLVLANDLSLNTSQSLRIGTAGSAISGDTYGTLPSGITLSGTGYQWCYSTTPGGTTTDISGATGATYTPNASVAPFNVAGTYYLYRKAIVSSTNNISPATYVATNLSNYATLVIQRTNIFTGTGNFSTVARWSLGLPIAGDNLIIDGACTVDNYAGTNNVTYGDLALSAGSTARTLNWAAGGTNVLNVRDIFSNKAGSSINMSNGGTLAINGSLYGSNLSFTAGTGTVDCKGLNVQFPNSIVLNNLTVSDWGQAFTSGSTVINGNVNLIAGYFSHRLGSLEVKGNWVNNSTAWAFSQDTTTIIFSGTAKSISGAYYNTFNNLYIAAGATVSQAVNNYVNNNLTIQGTFDASSYTIDRVESGGTLTIGATGKLKIGGGYSIPLNYSTHAINAASTVEFNGSGQFILPFNSSQQYGNIIVAASGTVQLSSSIIARGDLTVSSGTLDLQSLSLDRASAGGTLVLSNGATLRIGGAFPTNFSTHSIASGSTVNYAQSNQTIVVLNSSQAYGNLTVGSSGTKTLAGNIAVAGVLTLSGSTITTGAYALTLGSAGSVSRTSGHIIGNFAKTFSTGTVGKVFEIGDANYYTPVSIDYTNITTGGTLTASTSAGDHVNINTCLVTAANTVNRTWSLINNGIAATSYNATANFNVADLDITANTAGFIGGLYNGGSWSYPTVGTRTTTSTQLTGLTTYGALQIGNPCTPTTANAGPDQTGAATCGLTSLTLAANTPTIGTGAWSIVSGTGGNITTPSSPTSTFTSIAGRTYTLRWTITNGPCTSTDDVVIAFNQNPTTANAGPDQTSSATCGLTAVTLAGNTAAIGTGSWSIVSGTGGTVTTPSSSTSTFTGTAGTTYTLRWTISNAPCTASTDDVVITFNRNPTTANAGTDQSVCGNYTVLAGNTPTAGSGFWTIVSGTGGTINNQTIPSTSFTGVAGNTYTLRWTISNSPCTSSYDDVVLTFYVNPTTANAGADQTGSATCGLTAVTLAGNTATTGSGAWSIVSGTGGIITNLYSPASTFTGIAGNTYTLRWTITNGTCTASTDDVVITFNRIPTTANAGPDQTGAATCGLTSVTLAGNTPSVGTGAWSIVSGAGGTITAPSSASSTFTGTAGTTYTLRWTISNAPCTSSTDDVVISFSPNPTIANAGDDQTGAVTCGLTSVTLAANTPTIGTGVWSIVSGAGGTVTTPSNKNSTFTGVAGNTYTLRWTISNAPCTASADDVVIIFNQNPTTANAGTDQTGSATCGLTSLNLAANIPTIGTGVWSIVSGAGGTIANSSSPTSTFTGTAGTTYTLRWTISNSPCTASTDDVVVKFNASAGSAIISYAGTPYCINSGTATVTRTGTAGGAYSSTAGLAINSATGDIILGSSTAGTYTVTYTLTSGLCSSTATTLVTISAAPLATIGYTGSPYCSSAGTVTVTRTGTAGGTYSSTGGLAINAGTGDITLGSSTAGTYTVTYTVAAANGCSVYTTTTSVTVTRQPFANGTYPGSPYCSTGGTIYPSGSSVGASGTLSSTAGLSLNASTGAINLGTSTPGTYTVTYTVPASGGCAVYGNSTTVAITALPVATISYAGTPFCKSLATAQAVSRTGTAGGTYTSTAGLTINSGTGAITPSTSTAGTYTVTYTMAAALGCTAQTATTSVTITALPTVAINYAATAFCNSLSTTQTVTLAGYAGFTALGNYNGSYYYISNAGLNSPEAFSIAATMGLKAASVTSDGENTFIRNAANAAGFTGSYGIGLNDLATEGVFVWPSGEPLSYTNYSGGEPNNWGDEDYIEVLSNGYWNDMSSGQRYFVFELAGGVYSSAVGLTINPTNGAITPSTSTPGIYTVTYTLPATGGCAAKTATTSVTITAAPAATISYGGAVQCNGAGTAGVTLTGTPGGIFSSTAGLSINASNGTITLATSTPGTYTVTYTVASAGGCTAFQTTTSISIAAANTWTGTVSTDWNNASNWTCGIVPTSALDAIIPAGLGNYPVISTTGSVNNLTVESGASLTVNETSGSGTVKIYGAITNAGSINAFAGTVEMSGASNQTIAPNTFSNNSILNLKINSNVTLQGTQQVSGTLSFAGSNKTLTTNDGLVLKSTASETARLADITNGGAYTGNAIAGKVTIERHIPARRAWRLLAVPVAAAGAPTINAAWQEGMTSGNPNPGYGMQITGGPATNGFDLGVNYNPSLKIYADGGSVYGVTNTNIPITNYRGYFAFIRGNRGTNLFAGTAAPLSSTVLRMKGNLNTGDVQQTVAATGINLVGNPYASAIDFHSITKLNVNDKLWIWDPKMAGSAGLGGYVTLVWNGSDYDATSSASAVSRYIPSGEAFLVETINKTTTGTLTFKETDKTASGSDQLFRPVTKTASLRVDLKAIDASGNTTLSDGTLTTYNDIYTNAVDENDAQKLANTSENLSLKRNGVLLAIERRHSVETEDTTFINVTGLKKQNYQLQITMQQMTGNAVTAILKDKYATALNNTELNLDGVTSIKFVVNNDAGSYAADRFSIVFKPLVVLPVKFAAVKATNKQDHIAVEWKTENAYNVKTYEVETSSTGSGFKTAGSVNAATTTSADYSWKDVNMYDGIHYYRIKSVDADGHTMYSSIVKVTVGSKAGEIVVHPNVIIGGVINLQFKNMPGGQYKARLLDVAGSELFTETIKHPGGSVLKKLTLTKEMVKGIFYLEVTKPDGTGTTITLLNR